MALVVSTPRIVFGAEGLAAEALSLLVGAGFTLALFMTLAHFEDPGAVEPPAQIDDLRSVAIPMEPPPPPRQPDVAPPTEPVAGLTGIEIGASESPVRIAVVPPDLAALFPPTEMAPAAQIQVGRLYPDMKPSVDVAANFQHVFQQGEVDRIPTVVYRATPRIPRYVRKEAAQLRVILLLVVDQNGVATSVRLLKPSGNPEFDEIVAACVKDEWAFTPAIKAGKKVRCMLQQAVTIKWTRGTPFET